MGASLKGGKITITKTEIIFNQMIGKKKIWINSINNIDASGNMFLAIVSIITVIGIIRGIRMLQGLKQVTIKYGNDEEHTFWLTPGDLNELRSNL